MSFFIAENIVVDCSHQGLHSIPEFDAEESFSTWKLIMTGNPLRSIPSGAVKNLTDLTVNVAIYNRLKSAWQLARPLTRELARSFARELAHSLSSSSWDLAVFCPVLKLF